MGHYFLDIQYPQNFNQGTDPEEVIRNAFGCFDEDQERVANYLTVLLMGLPAVRRTQHITIGQKFLQQPMSNCYNGYMVNNNNIRQLCLFPL